MVLNSDHQLTQPPPKKKKNLGITIQKQRQQQHQNRWYGEEKILLLCQH